jgi:type VI secretion system protein ImpL
MDKIWQFFLDPRVLAVIGLAALAGLLLMGADALRIGVVWAVGVLALVLLGWASVWAWRRWQARKAAQAFEGALDTEADKAVKAAARQGKQDEVAAVRERMAEAVKLIKSSRLGETSGSAALYELPWYAVIGNPAAGKSSAVVKSGLKFPFADNTEQVIQGIGGTRHCDWYFTNEGILLDTAGRYAVHEEDRSEWLGFLGLLKRHRPKAPLNGVIIAVSIAELGGHRSDFAVDLAIKLRQRVQELTEKLEVFVPVYVVFTKADLIAGFVDFFEDRDRSERDKVWGATLPYTPTASAGKTDAVAQFDEHFDTLYQGLKEASVARMSLHRGEQLPPGVLTFPLEFAALKPALRTFINTLFEDNPYQFRPIFRGFYFTSAVQEGQSTSRASERVAEQFGLQLQPGTSAAVYAHSGFFLKELFSKVIFADRQLVQQYTSRNKTRLRYATFAGAALALGLMLAGWTWSYTGNRAWVDNVQADLARAQQVQDQRTDLASRLEALEILQDRLEQVQRQRAHRPWQLGLGLYQGDVVAERLKEEYHAGLQAVMLQPAAQAMASYLAEVNAHSDDLQPIQRLSDALAEGDAPAAGAQKAGTTAEGSPHSPRSPETPYAQASNTDVTQAYNALKAYLMLGDRQRLEAGHMSDQLTRFWRTWLDANRGTLPREQLIRRAEHLMAFAVSQMNEPDFPQMELNLSLLDQTRSNLRRVIKGMPARERVYSEIKARAATRFPVVTVMGLVSDADRGLIAGSNAVSGVFTREAWQDYIKQAIKDAAHGELQSTDWVLKTAGSDDLTLEGSPEQIEKSLVAMYKAEYVREWQRFMQGVSIQPFDSFDQAQAGMNRLGDPVASPIGKVFRTLYDQTSWDNPSALNDRLGQGKLAFIDWFKQKVLGLSPAPVAINLEVKAGGGEAVPMGPIGKSFSALNALMAPRSEGEPLFNGYLQGLAKVRSRFNQMKTQGDPGPAARKWMLETLEGGGELADTLKLIDEQMMNGVPDATRQTLRPLLVRPLMQAYAVVVQPAEADLNRTWTAQVYEPYQRTLANKYPFDRASRLEASPGEIAKVFGSEGAVAKFVATSLGALVTQRGDALAPRTWADMGVRLRPEFTTGLGAWVAPLAGQGPGATASAGGMSGAGGAGGAVTPAEGQTTFQILPLAAPGLSEFAVDIDGQTLRYRNGVAAWAPMVWPGPGQRGAHVTGVTLDGKPVSFFSEAGQYALEKLIGSAQRKRLEPQLFELRWTQAGLSVGIQLRILSNPAATPPPVAVPGPATGATAGAATAAGPVSAPGVLPPIVAGTEAPVSAVAAAQGGSAAPVTPPGLPSPEPGGPTRAPALATTTMTSSREPGVHP